MADIAFQAPSVATHRRGALLARISVAAGSTFVVLLAALHLLKPELDPGWRMISEYEIGRHGWLMQAAFLVLATATVALVGAARRDVQGRAGRVGLLLLLLTATGMALAALAVSDPITATPEELTVHGNLHGLGAMLGIPLFPVAAALVTHGLRTCCTSRRGHAAITVAAIGAALGLAQFVVVMAIAMSASGGFGPETPIGVPNRLLILSYVAWLIATALHLARAEDNRA